MTDTEKRTLCVPWPTVISGAEVTKDDLRFAYQEIIQPEQEKQRAGEPLSREMHVMLAVFRAVYGVMPEEDDILKNLDAPKNFS